MDAFRYQGLSTNTLQQLNRCRLYFQVARLSDITNIAGTHLYKHVCPPNREPCPPNREPATQGYQVYPTSRLQWPRQPRPGLKARKVWSTQIHMTFLQGDGRLRYPLGQWLQPLDHRDRLYPTIYHATSKSIHQYDGEKYWQLPIQSTSRRHICANTATSKNSKNTPGYPVDFHYIQDDVLRAEYTPRNTLVMPRSDQPIHQRLSRLPKWKHDLLKNSEIYDKWLPLLTQGVMVVTDGGVSEGKGYFGITIAHQNTVIARGRGAARGDPRTMCSFRAEAYGLLAGLTLLDSLLQQADKPPVTHSIHTDSASLLSRLEIATQRVPLGFWNKTDSDVIMQIVEEARHTTITRHYVKGHQDDFKKRSEMTLPEIYNIDSDASATAMRYEMNKPARTVIPFPASRVNIYIKHQHISSGLNSFLHQQFTEHKYWQYLENKFNWTTTTHKLIDWKTYHHMLNKQATKRHQQILKHAVEWLPTGHYGTHKRPH
jgi:hypothetical protein